MKKKEKIVILVLVIITIILIIVGVNVNKKDETPENTTTNNDTTVESGDAEGEEVGEFVKVLDDGTKLNTSSKLQEDKKLEGLTISNTQLTENGNVTLLIATVKNTSDSKQGGYPVSITILDKEGNEVVTLGGYINELEAGETDQLELSAVFDYSNAYDYTISKK